MQKNETIEQLNETKDELERVKKILLRTEEDKYMWRRLFEDCNKKQGEEIEPLRHKYTERPEQLGLATAIERSLPEGNFLRGQSPIELLTPRELSQTTEMLKRTAPFRVTIWDPSDTLGDPVGERAMQQLVEAADRLVANRSVPDSGMTAPYVTIDDSGRVNCSLEVIKKPGTATATKSAKTSKSSDRKIRKCLLRKCRELLTYRKTIN